MLLHTPRRRPATRRGTSTVLVAVLSTTLVGMVAFAVDIGWMHAVKNQLQVAADAAALAGAQKLYSGDAAAVAAAKAIGTANVAAGDRAVPLQDSDVVVGYWNESTKSFTAGGNPKNAVQVTATQTADLFFARIFGQAQATLQAKAIAMIRPRDIAFVIDLSGSMNNDSEIWCTSAINTEFASYGAVGSNLMQDVYTSFGYGTYPGTYRYIGDVPGASPSTSANSGGLQGKKSFQWLTTTYLTQTSIPTTYKILSGDSAATKTTKAYKWLMDYQLKTLMPGVKPTIDTASADSVAYWSDYLDYVIDGSGYTAPSGQNSYRMTTQGANPYPDAWPSLTSSSITPYANQVGYLTYVQFQMDYGWNKTAGNGTYVPLSRLSPDCPWVTDTNPASPGYNIAFPPREQPTHALRLAIMAGVDKVKSLNTGLPPEVQDHVCVITFDTANQTTVRYPLSANSIDYDAAKRSVRDMQAVADDQLSTASENGLVTARNHLDPSQNPGARAAAKKLMIFVTDGIPNIHQTSNTAIDNYITANAGKGEWFTSGTYRYDQNAVLMQTAQIKALGWLTYNMGIGLGCDYDMMDRMARGAGTGQTNPADPTGPKISPRAGGNPADYQARMTAVLNTILTQPRIQLVK